MTILADLHPFLLTLQAVLTHPLFHQAMAHLSTSRHNTGSQHNTGSNNRGCDTPLEGAAPLVTPTAADVSAPQAAAAAGAVTAATAATAASAAVSLLHECRSLLFGLLRTHTLSLALSPVTATPLSSSSSFSAQQQQQQQLLQRKALRSLLLQCLPHCRLLFSEEGEAGG